MQSKQWIYKNAAYSRAEIFNFSNQYKIPPMIASVLYNRNLRDKDVLVRFLKKGLDGVENPLTLPDIDKAVDRILLARERKEKVVIYGDYDVDGITSTALLQRFFTSIGIDSDYYIPDRHNEGYGVNALAVSKLRKKGYTLMVTVDCGITAVGEVELGKTLGLDTVITDHHSCQSVLPNAVAVVNPKIEGSGYPFDDLAGVGVAFKVALAVAIKLGIPTKKVFEDYVELAGVGTVADVVSLLGENRIIVDRALIALKNSKYAGLRAILESAGAYNKPITAATIGFTVAPRLNAAGRLGSAQMAVRLLLTDDAQEAEQIAAELEEANRARQLEEQRISEEAEQMLSKIEDIASKKVIVLAGKDWHHGVIGIVASRICEKLYRPTVLISYGDDGVGKGSGRSVPGFDLFLALSHCEEYLTKFGGHSGAAGLTVDMDSFDEFSSALENYVAQNISDEDLIPRLSIDCNISTNDITMPVLKQMQRLEPYGPDNERPVFSTMQVPITSVTAMGQDNRHARFRIDGINAVGFGMAKQLERFKNGEMVDVVYTVDINRFKDLERVQMTVKDIRRHTGERIE